MPSLSTLDPRFRPYAEAFFDWARSLGAPLVVTSARRTWTEQASLYKRYVRAREKRHPRSRLRRAGRSVRRAITGHDPLLALPPGTSQHELGLAFDMATPGVDPHDDQWLHWLGPIWRARMNGVWGGDVDPVHFEASKAFTGRA